MNKFFICNNIIHYLNVEQLKVIESLVEKFVNENKKQKLSEQELLRRLYNINVELIYIFNVDFSFDLLMKDGYTYKICILYDHINDIYRIIKYCSDQEFHNTSTMVDPNSEEYQRIYDKLYEIYEEREQ